MNKKRPNEIRQQYSQEADNLVAFFIDTASGIAGSQHEKRNLTTLCELVFLNSYVAFETFLSDLFLAYINKKSITYQNSQEKKIKKLIGEQFGEWYEQRTSLHKASHLSANEVENLLDPKGYNLTFSRSSDIRRLAAKWLDQDFKQNIFMLSQEDLQFIDCCREIRNAISHKSKRSFDSMNTLLRSVPTPSTIDFIHRPTNSVKNVGVFLKSMHGEEFRVIKCIDRLKDISSRM